MIPRDPDRETSPAPSSSGLVWSGDPEATTIYPPSDARPAGARAFEFLGSPRAEGELGWLAHYRIKSLLGEGGIGLVFLAEDTQLARPVALKVIKPELARAPRVQDRFLREAQATAAIKHDHIVTIYQVGRDDDTLFLAMEYLRGLSLQGWLDRGRKPSMDLVLRIGREIASGLAAAHRNGLVHRDIKPANIWLEAPSGRVKILDFGMARSERDEVHITHAGTVMGTPAYMAPEQARGETAGAASDLFSLGCVLYRLCSGRLPFEGESILAVLSALASVTPRSLREIEPAVGPALEELVSRLLAKDPSARPASAQAVVDAIRAVERESLAERQRVEISDDPHRPLDAIVLAPPAAGAAGVREGPRPKSSVRRIGWTIAAVAAAALPLGSFVIARPLRGIHETEARKAVQTPAHAASAVDAVAAKNAGADPTPRPIGEDRSLPVVAAAPTMPGKDPPTSAARPALSAPRETRQMAHRSDADAALDDGPPGIPEARRVMKHGEELPAPGAPASTTAIGSTVAMPRRDDWGTPIDPDGDCKFEFDRKGNGIRITVPGTPHVLSAELERRNAPRVLQPVRGDFDASVIVNGVFRPSGRATTRDYAPYHGAGILLWQDERNYVRLEIAADLYHGKPRSYANFELRKGGGLAVSKGIEIKDGSTRLLLQRRGDEVRAAFGPDGARWTWFAPLVVELDDRLSLGVTAINSATKPLDADLEMFAITKRGRGGDIRERSDTPR
jgi:serine/threonine protein kinase